MTKKLDELEKQKRMQNFLFNNFKLLLFISVTDFDDYSENETIYFAEHIEENIDLIGIETIKSYFKEFEFDNEIQIHIHNLNEQFEKIFSSSWNLKMKSSNNEWNDIKATAFIILNKLHIEYIEPLKFSDENFEFDWF